MMIEYEVSASDDISKHAVTEIAHDRGEILKLPKTSISQKPRALVASLLSLGAGKTFAATRYVLRE